VNPYWLLNILCCTENFVKVGHAVFGRPFINRFAPCYRTVVLSVLSVCNISCLSVTLVYCGQTVGRIKMKFGMQVGLSAGHIVLHKDLAPLPKKGADLPIFGPCLSWLNGWMDQDVNWYGGRPRRRPHCARWGPSSPQKGGTAPPNFWPMSVVPPG